MSNIAEKCQKMVIKSSLNGKNAGSGANFVDFQAQYSICDNFTGVEGILECQGATGNQINSMLQPISGGGVNKSTKTF